MESSYGEARKPFISVCTVGVRSGTTSLNTQQSEDVTWHGEIKKIVGEEHKKKLQKNFFSIDDRLGIN